MKTRGAFAEGSSFAEATAFAKASSFALRATEDGTADKKADSGAGALPEPFCVKKTGSNWVRLGSF